VLNLSVDMVIASFLIWFRLHHLLRTRFLILFLKSLLKVPLNRLCAPLASVGGLCEHLIPRFLLHLRCCRKYRGLRAGNECNLILFGIKRLLKTSYRLRPEGLAPSSRDRLVRGLVIHGKSLELSELILVEEATTPTLSVVLRVNPWGNLVSVTPYSTLGC